MTSELLAVDPQALAVLQEVAADPASTLLRMPPSKSLASFRESAFGSGRNTAGLTAAERELLLVHRAEVAWLLRQACLVMLVEGEAGRRFVNAYRPDGEHVEMASPSEIMQMSERERTAADPEVGTALERLAEFGAWPGSGAPSIRELAALAHRIEPTNQTRLIVALDMAMQSELRTALHLLAEVEAIGPSDHERLRVHEYTALILARLGKHAEACQRLNKATDMNSMATTAVMARFLCGLLAGMREHVVESDRLLEATVTTDQVVVGTVLSAMIRQRDREEWTLTVRARRLAGELSADLGPVGRRIVDELV